MGFVFGAYPPGRMFSFKTAGVVLLNMMRAHTAAYRAIKAMPGGDKHKIGMTHMVIPFTSWPDLGPLTAHSRWVMRRSRVKRPGNLQTMCFARSLCLPTVVGRRVWPSFLSDPDPRLASLRIVIYNLGFSPTSINPQIVGPAQVCRACPVFFSSLRVADTASCQ